MHENDHDALTILGKLDALFWPFRQPGKFREVSTICQARWAYAKSGVAFQGTGGTAERKSQQRRREELASAGIVTVVRSKGRIGGVKLTARAEMRARAAIGLPRMGACLAHVHRLRRLANDGKPIATDRDAKGEPRWVPETQLLGRDYAKDGCPQAFHYQSDVLIPAIHRDWVTSNASVDGHVWFALGDNASEIPAELPAELAFTFTTEDLENIDQQEAQEIYDSAFQLELDSLRSSVPLNATEIGQIPMSSGCGWNGRKRAPTEAQWGADGWRWEDLKP